ncbi:MAG: DNA polymerase III subunit beta [Gammaproteobacteria bacterium]|nr:DNA polymerase III subunit beta [Gammaproteobacteria bacterium]
MEKRQTLPILSNVLVDLNEDTMRIVATDLEMEVIARCKADYSVPGKITVPMRKLQDTCKTLPEESLVQFELKEDRAILKSGKTRFTLTTLPADDFPVISTKEPLYEFEISQGVLKNLVEKTSFAMAVQDVRFYLNGLLLELEDKSIKCVATDGHRLALCSAEAPNIHLDEKIQAIIPRKAVAELTRLLDSAEKSVKVTLGENFLRLDFDGLEFTTKLIDGKYPNYQGVIPTQGNNIVTAEKDSIRQCLIRTSILSNEKYRGIRLDIEQGVLNAVANNPEQEEAIDEIVVEYNGEPLTIGFNVNYLLEAVTAVPGDEVKIALSDSNGSALITAHNDSNCCYVVMPMRL